MSQEHSLVERIAAEVGAHTGSHAAFGPIVDHDGVTVVPVARLGFGFGGGERPEGQGGGGGGGVDPVGYLRIADRKVSWHPIVQPRNIATGLFQVAVGIGLGLFLAARGAAALELARRPRAVPVRSWLAGITRARAQ